MVKFTIKDTSRISFGKLSDRGVLEKTHLAKKQLEIQHFNSRNFQYIVDNIADMFGISPGTISVAVIEDDHVLSWMDLNGNGQMEDEEFTLQFTMNASINTYSRESNYGKYYLYSKAMEYGYPVIFGIAAHEVGHLVNRYLMTEFETKIIGGTPCMTEVKKLNDRWDELCADYLAGIVLASATPRLDAEPMRQLLFPLKAGETHPDGFWRVFAFDMGYQWGCAHSPILKNQVLTNSGNLKQLLISFFTNFYNQIYCGVDPHTRGQHCTLSNILLENCMNPIGVM